MTDQKKREAWDGCGAPRHNLPCLCCVESSYNPACRAAHKAWYQYHRYSPPPPVPDPVSHPPHYTQHPSGVECIQITEHMGFCLGNAVKYIWRADLKHDAVEDLRKARWYLDREIARRTAGDDDAQGR